ncbi:autotransporter domain-containing protein [Pseudomonas sp. SA3-5]|uniref:Autotransporter domain-containing protein n=1 Tax=Pseudomonas aestuarii TaxID=3018340 RepID=A0ABT4XEQ6_9PSED|nr:autotransporter-associated beta strand repeat-containing protein [Pseudomonas aestuarii]MDA7086656.1 autotransporter domain-containing protein [Pseudomonas aestuarii]
MNRIYCSIFNTALGTWVAVPETAKARGKSNGGARTARGARRAPLFACTALVAGMAMAGMASAQTWTGTTDTNWDTATNWTGGTPAAAGTADINAAAGNQPTLGSVTPGLTATNVSAGTLTISAGGELVSTDVNISGAGAIHNAGAISGNVISTGAGTGIDSAGTINGNLSSGGITTISAGSVTGALAVTGGTTTVSGGATVGGDVNVGGGVLTLGAGTNLGPNSNRVVVVQKTNGNARMDLGGNTVAASQIIANIASGTSFTNGTVTVANLAQIGVGTIDAVLAGAGTFRRVALNPGIASTFTAANTYTGATDVQGRLVISSTGSILNTASITIDGAGVLRVDGAGGNAISDSMRITNNGAFEIYGSDETIGSIAGTGNISVASGTNLILSDGTTHSIDGVVSGAGGLTIDKSAGVVTLSGTNAHTGATTLEAGGLTLAGGAAIADTGAVVVNGGTLTLSDSETIGTLSGSGGAIQLGSNTLTVNAISGSADYAGAISGSGGLGKTGAGTLALSGTNTYTGDTTLTAGTVAINNAGALGADSGYLWLAGGTLLATESLTLGKANLITQSGTTSTIAAANGKTLTLTGNVNPIGSNAVLNFGAAGQEGTVVASNMSSATNTARVNVAGGTLRVGAGEFINSGLGFIAGTSVAGAATLDMAGLLVRINNLSGTGTVNSSAGSATLQTLGTSNFGGTIADGAGTSNLDVSSGALTLSGGNTYTGTTLLSGGNLTLTGAGALASTDVTINAGRTLTTQGGAATGLAAATALTNSGVLALTGDEEIGSIAGAGAVTLDAHTLTIGGLNSSTELSGVVSGTGGLIKSGTGQLTLSGANTYVGQTAVTAGTLDVTGSIASTSVVVEDSASLTADGASLSDAASVTLNGTGSLTVNSATETIGSLSAAAGSTVVLNAGLTVGDTADTTVAGAISGIGALTKVGAGTLLLSGGNTYSGGTTISAGTLVANNTSGSATGSGAVTVASGSALGGSGSIAGSVTVADGGRLAAGNSPGNLTLGELLLNNASVLDYELASPSDIAGVDSDLITVTGNLTLDGILNITDLGGFDFAVSSGDTGSYRLFNYGGTLIDNVISFGSGLLAGYNYSIDTATAGAVTLVADFTGLQFWDGNNNIANATVDGGNGTWSAGDTNWTNQSGNTNSNSGELTAIFGGTAGTVEVDGSHTVQGLQFVTDNYLLQDTDNNGALVLADSGADVRADSGVNAVIDVALGGTGSLSKTGAGTITLQGNNTYTGDTIISDGTLQLGDNNRIANTSDLVINGGTFDLNNFNETVANLSGSGGTINIGAGGTGTLTVNQTVDQTYAGNFSGASGRFQDAIIKNGAATLTLTGTNSQTGVGIVQINAGRLAVEGGNAIGDSQMLTGVGEFELLSDETIGFLNMSGGQVLLNDNTLTLGSNSDVSGGTYAAISGTGNIIIDGDALQVFYAASTYTGSTTINSGELRTRNLSALGNNSAVAVNSGGALLLLDDLNIGSLAGDGAVTLTSLFGSHRLTSGADNTSTTFSGVLSGAGGRLNKTGTGTLTLTGSNTYTGGTTISAGVLQGTTASLQGDIINNATLAFDQDASGTFSEVISGSGALSKSGSGTLILSGANSYSGGTTISAGVLQGTTASLQGDIINDATLAFDQDASGTFSEVISGSGALSKSGSGTLILSGANSYSGGTTISAGVLQGTTASLQGDIINNATLAFDQDASGTFSEVISGSGALSKSGSGTLILSGANSYSGGTTVSGGILQGSSTSLQGDIGNNAMINFDQAADGVYAGVMKGSGSLIKSGAGMLTLSGMSSYSGTTIIEGGRLAVNGSIANSATTINAGGTLGGSGIVGSISLNGGVLAPGNSIGTLNVAGDLDFSAGGVFEVEVDAAGNSDRIDVTGSAVLTNGTVLVLPEAGDYKVSTDYTILTAAGGLGGTTFGSVSSNLAFLTPTLSYDANNVLLNLRRNSSDYASVAETANQGSVGTALDTLFGSDSAGADELFNNLNILSAAGASQAYDSLSGVQHTYSNQIALQSLNQFKGLLFDRLQGNSQFLARNGQLMLAYNDNGTVTDVGSQLLGSRPVADRGWWLRGTGSYGEIDGTRNASGAHYNASGTATGIDVNLDDSLTLGAAFGYNTTGAGVDQGDLEVDSYQAAFYGRWLLDDGYYASGIAGFGYHDIDAKRGINVGISSSTAKSDYDAWTGNVAVEAGRTFALNQRTRITPLAGLEYAHINRESFTEHGAGAADLHVSRDQQDSLRSALGARLEHSWTTNNGSRIQPTIELAWLHEFMDNEAGLRAGFAPAPTATFNVSGPELDRDRARIGLGLNMQVNETASLRLGYQGEFASSDQRHDVSATFKMAW